MKFLPQKTAERINYQLSKGKNNIEEGGSIQLIFDRGDCLIRKQGKIVEVEKGNNESPKRLKVKYSEHNIETPVNLNYRLKR